MPQTWDNVTVRQIAKYFGVTFESVYSWIKTAQFPQNEDGTVNVFKALTWAWQEQERRVAQAKRGGEGAEELRLREQRAKTELLEIEVARENREVVNVSAGEAILVNAILSIRSRMLTIPKRLAAEVNPNDTRREIESRLDGLIREVLSELSGIKATLRHAAGSDEGLGGDDREVIPPTEAPQEDDSQRVGGQVQAVKPRVKRRARSVENVEG